MEVDWMNNWMDAILTAGYVDIEGMGNWIYG
jgi:hypothetical protein